MGVRVQYSDGSERWCESCADPSDSGGSVVQGGTEHNVGGGTSISSPSNSPSQGPGGTGVTGTMANAATQADRSGAYSSFYSGGATSGPNPSYAGPNQPGGPAAGGNPGYGVSGLNNAAGNPKTATEWSFDPTMPNRAISAGMSGLGLPTFGPAADFYTKYGLPGVSQALASGAFYSPDSFKQAILSRLQGGDNGMDPMSMVRALMGGEGLAQAQNKPGYTGTASPQDSARAAYISQMENDPAALAQLLTGTLASGPNGASTSVESLLGNYLGNIATRRFNSSIPQNDTLQYLGKLIGG